MAEGDGRLEAVLIEVLSMSCLAMARTLLPREDSCRGRQGASTAGTAVARLRLRLRRAVYTSIQDALKFVMGRNSSSRR
jgi:hypothetical protein